jgi:hypothetical protein
MRLSEVSEGLGLGTPLGVAVDYVDGKVRIRRGDTIIEEKKQTGWDLAEGFLENLWEMALLRG